MLIIDVALITALEPMLCERCQQRPLVLMGPQDWWLIECVGCCLWNVMGTTYEEACTRWNNRIEAMYLYHKLEYAGHFSANKRRDRISKATKRAWRRFERRQDADKSIKDRNRTTAHYQLLSRVRGGIRAKKEQEQ